MTSWRQPPLVRMSVPQASDRAGSTLPPARDVRCEARACRGKWAGGGGGRGLPALSPVTAGSAGAGWSSSPTACGQEDGRVMG